MSNIVPPIGPKNAKIFLCGEAPGLEEERNKIPFVGSSGKILNTMLREAGIDRAKCRIDNVANVRPPGNNFGHFYEDKQRRIPKPALIEQRKRLHQEIESTNPNVIIALGAEALKALTDHQYITKWRGSILMSKYGKLVPTIHPASVMRQWSLRPIVIFDLKRAKLESKQSFLVEEDRTLITAPSLARIKAECNHLSRAKYLAFDIETQKEGWPKRVTCIGFSASKHRAICIPLTAKDGGHYWKSTTTEIEVWEQICSLLSSPAKKIAQNAPFDISILSYMGVPVKNLWADTMIMHHCLHPELPKGLDFLCSVYTRQPYYKDMIRKDLWEYNCLDACVTYEVAMVLLEELEEFGTKDFYFQHAHPMIEPLIDIQAAGVQVNTKLRTELGEALTKSIKEKQELLNEAVGHELNVNSPKQMQHFLYEELRLEKKYHRTTGNVTVNEEALEKLAKKHPSKLFRLILSIRGDIKLLSTWIQAPLGKDGRIRTSYVVSDKTKDKKTPFTVSGRLTSRKYLDGTGTNLQNVPEGPARQMVIPKKGNVFVSADLRQAEDRVVAYLINDVHKLQVYAEGGDPHAKNASNIFRKPESEVTYEERKIGKTLVHAANYGISAKGFAAYIGSSISDAQELLTKYYTAYPGVELLQLKVVSQLKKTRTLTTPMGRKRLFFGRLNKETFREAYSYKPQSTVGDITHQALVSLYWALPEGARVALHIHDNLVIECGESQVEEVKHVVKNAMEFSITVEDKELTIPIDFKVGKNWDEL